MMTTLELASKIRSIDNDAVTPVDFVDQVMLLVERIEKEQQQEASDALLTASGEVGLCPHCGSDDLEFDSSEFVDDQVVYTGKCNTCGKSFKEWYNLHQEYIDAEI